MGWVGAFLFPPLGIIVGAHLLSAGQRKQGTWILAVACVILVLAIVAGLTDDSSAAMI